ncbi:hypothetical protein SBA2_380027 [Acidobacteriia bacterium SbA2]|nr:hypothetical protein SBA2_380027 [Acidobacteriia bacterium SbA2]
MRVVCCGLARGVPGGADELCDSFPNGNLLQRRLSFALANVAGDCVKSLARGTHAYKFRPSAKRASPNSQRDGEHLADFVSRVDSSPLTGSYKLLPRGRANLSQSG